MAANLPPQFFELQKRLNLTQDVEEKIEILKEMLAICPKHKGTERVQEEIKKKIAKLKKEEPKRIKREALFFVKKEGAGQVLVLGPPNSGKTSLVNALCNTSFKVANYPFSTRLPQPAMVDYENIKIQIVDTPPISKDFRPGWMKNLARGADLILVLIDLTENPKESLKEILEILNEWGIEKDKILILGNKTDLKKNGEDLKIFEVSAKEKIGVEELKKKIFEALKIVRVFTKGEKEKVNFNAPFVLKEGTRLIDFVKEINKEWVERFKGAKLYSKDLKRFQMVGRDYILKDGDIVEIKT